MEKSIYIKNQKIYYRERGKDGPVFLIIHGWHDCVDYYFKFQDKLAKKGFKVFLPFLPGFKSSKLTSSRAWHIDDYIDYILEFAAKLKLKDFYLMGHSLSALTAIKLAISHPEKVRSLVLCSPIFMKIRSAIPTRFLMFIGSPFFAWTLRIGALFSRIIYFLRLPLPHLWKKIFQWLRSNRNFYTKSGGAMYKTLRNIVSEDLSEISTYLEKIKTPTIIVWGNQDKIWISRLEKAAVFKEKIKGSVLKILSGGHSIQKEATKKLVDCIIKFIEAEKYLVHQS